MHVFEDLLILENVDGENRPVSPGAFGEKLLVTVLFSRTQPLIRYEISDSVRFAEAAPGCGLPFQVIDQVQGRREDILTLSGLDGSSTTVHPNVFHDVMDAIPNRGWQIVQQATGLQVLVVPLGPLEPDAITRQVLAALLEQGAGPVEIEVRRADAIPKSASGKSPLIQAYRGSDPPSG
jgi:phenylacetate-CoA ligase